MDRFSLVGEQGSTGGSEGGAVLVGQEQGVSPWVTTPEFEHLVGVDTLAATAETAVTGDFLMSWPTVKLTSSP